MAKTGRGTHRLISSVHLGNVKTLNVLDGRVHSQPPGKRDRQVISKGTVLSALVGEVIDKTRVLAVFAGEDFLEFKDWGIELSSAVALKDFGDGAEDLFTARKV
jgi:nickel-dependent lactate racemase